jgi:hypothetical protein
MQQENREAAGLKQRRLYMPGMQHEKTDWSAALDLENGLQRN